MDDGVTITRSIGRGVVPWILLLSGGIFGFLVWLIYMKDAPAVAAPWVAALPAVNAALNASSAVCLIGGFIFIRRGDRLVHRRFMLSAVLFSAMFLVSYVVYHHFHGDTRFMGQGIVRPIYFAILISHIVLSGIALPMVFGTLYLAGSGRFETHRRLARFTLPVWLYVSVTGVVVFLFLKTWG
jgi:putative membrane protein